MTNRLKPDQLNAIHLLLDRVASRQRQDFGNIVSDVKPDGTLITACDRWSDAALVEGIAAIAPDEGVPSEEGAKQVPTTDAYWVIDPLDGTTNFAAGIPYWAISVARCVKGQPQEVFLDVPALNQRIVAVSGQGAWRNGKRLSPATRQQTSSQCVSLCSRSIRILQRRPDQRFPGKMRLLGVASLNLVSVAMGQTIASIEATPKIWDLAAAWLVLQELGCSIHWLDRDPSVLAAAEDLSEVGFPVLAAASDQHAQRFLSWAQVLTQD